ncbi:MAG: hypothetical protein QNJ84_13620 [Alphaproteobacteria bacterium]|nr:hypothetical protein [Alphaproteobacteria bacterium]
MMKPTKQDMTVRSVPIEAIDKLSALQQHTRLTYGGLIDDAIEALWDDYLSEGHEVPMLSSDQD